MTRSDGSRVTRLVLWLALGVVCAVVVAFVSWVFTGGHEPDFIIDEVELWGPGLVAVMVPSG